ncbi:MerC domain-containing protein [Kordia jejudonensis]|uniref:MerC domain-containing protein n=1 Tax=Kordia jejudonensis TaxID=1348245 RepID=UPI0006298259|nr:MerC domain-containing protein [Kordia jejudonensis]
MILNKSNSDFIGAFTSSLCLLHCICTPFLFMVQTHAISHSVSAPFWWKILDFVFLIISFIAIYWSSKTTSKQWMKFLMWITWLCLCLFILNEKLAWFSIPEYAIYLPGIGLIVLHVYNKKYCQCKDDQCCALHV